MISGSAKGRRLYAVPGDGTRPITDRVKSALYDILSTNVIDSQFLDLFGGTGSVGIEALSRGAAHVVFVERARKAVATIHRNLELTGLSEDAEVIHGDAFRYLEHNARGELFDFVYVAPPQYKDLWAQALLELNKQEWLAPDGIIIVQIHPRELHDVQVPNLRHYREARYGDTVLEFYERADRPDALEDD